MEAQVCVTAQHRAMLDQALEAFGVRPDFDLDLMLPDQSLSQTASGIFSGFDPILAAGRFDIVVVQGDTTTTMASAVAAFYNRIPVAHVEAGLRTGDLAQPFPEELNRRVASRAAALHFAPTETARLNLLAEGVPSDRVFVTGNTVIDAVLYVSGALKDGTLKAPSWPFLNGARKLIVVTAHRRESFGAGIDGICEALACLAARGDVQIVYPVHRNPNVLDAVTRHLGGLDNVALLEPLDYISFIDLMRRAWLLITDSGGIQEEAPSLGKPVLVTRDRTERPEAVEAGTVKLVGTDPRSIVREAAALLEDDSEYARMARVHNPYGDGQASERIVGILKQYLASHD